MKERIYMASPTMHGEEFQYMKEAYDTNWMSTVGANINEVEKNACEKIGCKHAVALSAGTAALHMAIKLAGMDVYGQPEIGHGALEGKKVFCLPHCLETKTGVGNNRLIQQGAKLVVSTEDILEELKIIQNNEATEENEENVEIAEEYKPIYNCLTYELTPIDSICSNLKCKISELNYLITMMEMENLIEVMPGNMIKRK